MSKRTIADIEADIVDFKNGNPKWHAADAGDKALITALTNEKFLLLNPPAPALPSAPRGICCITINFLGNN
jgi:hypothetical protein